MNFIWIQLIFMKSVDFHGISIMNIALAGFILNQHDLQWFLHIYKDLIVCLLNQQYFYVIIMILMESAGFQCNQLYLFWIYMNLMESVWFSLNQHDLYEIKMISSESLLFYIESTRFICKQFDVHEINRI